MAQHPTAGHGRARTRRSKLLRSSPPARLWLMFGAGRYMHTSRSFWIHHRLQRWYTASLMAAAKATCGLRIDVEDESPASRGNAIVLGRHTSIGDALIPAVLFAGRFDLNTRYVLKDDLLWGPAFDIVGNRLRNHFVDRAPDDSAAELAAIGRLMDGFDDRCVAVIFPEGTFFSPERKARAVQRLNDAGRHELASRAEALRYLLAAAPGGALALLAGAPSADAVLVGNSGFERFNSLGAIYRSVPFAQPVRVWLWRVPNNEIPKAPDTTTVVALRPVGTSRRVDPCSPGRRRSVAAMTVDGEVLEIAVDIARRAGQLTLQWFQSSSLTIERKRDGTPVTQADRAAERLHPRRAAPPFPRRQHRRRRVRRSCRIERPHVVRRSDRRHQGLQPRRAALQQPARPRSTTGLRRRRHQHARARRDRSTPGADSAASTTASLAASATTAHARRRLLPRRAGSTIGLGPRCSPRARRAVQPAHLGRRLRLRARRHRAASTPWSTPRSSPTTSRRCRVILSEAGGRFTDLTASTVPTAGRASPPTAVSTTTLLTGRLPDQVAVGRSGGIPMPPRHAAPTSGIVGPSDAVDIDELVDERARRRSPCATAGPTR